MATPHVEPAVARLRQRWQRVLAAVAVAVLPWLIAPGLVQPDTKLDLTLSPWRYLGRATEAWSTQTGIGELQNQAYGYIFPMGPFHGICHSLGISAWATQRLWWTLVLVVAFVGTERLLRRLGVSPGVPALLGAVVYALSPRVLTMLTESSVELWPYALAPWLVLVVMPALGPDAAGRDRRRAAIRTAGLAACLGGVNATVTAFALVPAALWVLSAPRHRGRARLSLWWLAAVLAGSLWWLVPLVVLGRYSYPFLDYIEVASTTTGVTTILNVLRGADHWLAYILTDAGHPVWQGGWVLAQSVAAVLGTCLLAGLGIGGLVRHRQPDADAGSTDRPAAGDPDPHTRHTFRWALLSVILGVLCMGIARSGTASGPFAGEARDLLDGALAPLRNVHKADLLVRLPMALGVGLLASWLADNRISDARSRWWRQAGVVAMTMGLLGSLLPVWEGRVADAWGYERIPLSWHQVAGDIDREHDSTPGATLLLPSSRSAHYTWGKTGDEPLVALATSPVLARSAAPLGHPGATRLLERVDRLASSGRAEPQLPAALRRLGVVRVVVRHDLAADESTLDPVAMDDTLDATPGIDFVRTRGAGAGAITEWRVAPGPDAGSPVRTDPTDSMLAVAGSPEGVVDVEASGLVPAGRPVLLGADAAAVPGMPWVATDTQRWQSYNAGRPAPWASSPTLRSGNDLPSLTGFKPLPPGEDRRWATTRAWPGYDAVEVSSTSANPFARTRGSARSGPAALVDGDVTTTWTSDAGDPAPLARLALTTPVDVGDGALSIELPDDDALRPQEIHVRVFTDRADRPGVDTVVPVSEDGDSVDVMVSGLVRRVELSPRSSEPQGQVGLSEVTLGEAEDVYPASRRPGTALTLAQTPTPPRSVLITRDIRAAADISAGEDPAGLRRAVRGLDGPVSVRAWVRPRGGAATEGLLDRGWDLAGSTRPATRLPLQEALRARPGAALDGDGTTHWQPDPAERRPVLAVDLGRSQTLTGIRLSTSHEGFVKIATDSGTTLVPARAGVLAVPPGATRAVTLTFTRSSTWTAPELELLGPARADPGPTALPCGGAGSVVMDSQRVRLTATLTPAEVLSGAVVAATPCTDDVLQSSPDASAVEVTPSATVVPERVLLTSTREQPATTTGDRQVLDVTGAATSRTVDLGPGSSTVLTTGQGASAGWVAKDSAGRPLQPLTVDGWRQAFVVPEGEATSVSIDFAPSRAHRLGLLGGGAVAILCLLGLLASALRGALERRRPSDTADVGEGTLGPGGAQGAPLWVGALLGGLVASLVAGAVGVVAGVVGGLLPPRWRAPAAVVLVGGAGVAVAALGTADQLSLGSWAAQAAGSVVLGIVSSALVSRPSSSRPARGEDGGAAGAEPRGGSTTPTPGER